MPAMNLPNALSARFPAVGGLFSAPGAVLTAETAIPRERVWLPDGAGFIPALRGSLPGGGVCIPAHAGLVPDAAVSIPHEMGWLPGRKGIHPGRRGFATGGGGIHPAGRSSDTHACGIKPVTRGMKPGCKTRRLGDKETGRFFFFKSPPPLVSLSPSLPVFR